MESQQQHLDSIRSALIGTVGILYIGVAGSAALYGITCAQTLTYIRSEAKDKRPIKLAVYSLWALDTAHQGLVIHALWFYLIAQYANPAALGILIWSIPTAWFINTIISTVVDLFLLWRLWIVSQNKYYSLFCAFGLLVQIGCNLSACIIRANPILYQYGNDLTLVNNIKSLLLEDVQGATSLKTAATSAITTESAMSVLLSGGLAYYLFKQRSGFDKTNDILRRLVIIFISTGLIASAFCWAEIISFYIAPTKLYTMFFNFMIGKLYINALLTSLNYRKHGRGSSSQAIELSNTRSDATISRIVDINRSEVKEHPGDMHYAIGNWPDDEQALV